MITTKVFVRTKYNQTPQSLSNPNGHYNLKDIGKVISKKLTKKVVDYALKRSRDVGFDFVKDWNITVETNDGDLPVNERYYHVIFTNPNINTTKITLNGIMVDDKGNPIYDNNFELLA